MCVSTCVCACVCACVRARVCVYIIHIASDYANTMTLQGVVDTQFSLDVHEEIQQDYRPKLVLLPYRRL